MTIIGNAFIWGYFHSIFVISYQVSSISRLSCVNINFCFVVYMIFYMYVVSTYPTVIFCLVYR